MEERHRLEQRLRMVLTTVLGGLLVLTSLLYWRRKPQDTLPLYVGIAMLLFRITQPDRSGYDHSIMIMAVSVQILSYALVVARHKRGR